MKNKIELSYVIKRITEVFKTCNKGRQFPMAMAYTDLLIKRFVESRDYEESEKNYIQYTLENYQYSMFELYRH